MRRAARRHATTLAAFVVLVACGVATASYVVAHQNAVLPAWIPIFGEDDFTLHARFASAQAIVPGQGQTVTVAGVRVGEVSGVKLVDGRAVVTLRIRRGHARVYRDATLLLRPKTLLKDMVIELTPGTPGAGRVADGGTLPLANTLPDVNPDEILAGLDADTRDDLVLLLTGTGEGLGGQGATASRALRRLAPATRDLDLVAGALASRRQACGAWCAACGCSRPSSARAAPTCTASSTGPAGSSARSPRSAPRSRARSPCSRARSTARARR